MIMTCKNTVLVALADKFELEQFRIRARIYIYALYLAETITILIETKTAAETFRSRSEVCATKRARPSTSSFYRSQIECRFSRILPKQALERGRNRRAVLALDLPKCIRCADVVVVVPRVHLHEAPRDIYKLRYSILSRARARELFRFTLSSLRRGAHERVLGGSLVYLHADTQKSVRVCSRTRGPFYNPLIGFIRASSITFSQGYTPFAVESGPTTRIYHGNFTLPPAPDSPRHAARY